MAQHIKSEQLEVNEVGNLCTARKRKKDRIVVLQLRYSTDEQTSSWTWDMAPDFWNKDSAAQSNCFSI